MSRSWKTALAIGVAIGVVACGGDDSTGAAATDGGAVPTPDAGAMDAANMPPQDASASDTGPADAGRAKRAVWVAGGQDMRRVVSFDGKTWGHDVYVKPNGLDNAFTCFAIGGGLIVAVGDPGVWTSPDGVAWTQVKMPEQSYHACAAAFTDDGTYAFVHGDLAYTSKDGLTWKGASATGDSGHWHAMAWGGGHFVAVGDGGHKASEDGLAWHDMVATEFNGVAYGNGHFVMVGNGGHRATSTDGVVWANDGNDATAADFGSVTFGQNHFVATDCCSAYSSPDGVTWTKEKSGVNGTVLFGDSQFVGAGWRTTIRQSSDGKDFAEVWSGDGPNMFDSTTQAPWLTGLGFGYVWQ